MNATRAILYFVGIALIVGALWMFFVQANLNRWIPIGIAVAAVILLVGAFVMSFAENTPNDRAPVANNVIPATSGGGNTTIVERAAPETTRRRRAE